ncbi:DUF3781 domain-containing protein [Flammeovirga sp. OC4]|uniref:DUF3781 domain-containing protein n=1 Tax=Flammeovirga sp. OC4 TaxID=1382345 RepID=UPI0005C641A3
MIGVKQKIIENHYYTDLVYGRINKKLTSNLSNGQIELFIDKILKETDEKSYVKKGKNYYVTNSDKNVRITINSNTFRVITVDKLK